MSASESNPQGTQNGWAKPIDKLKVGETPREAINLNVEGRRLAGLTHGFGQLWQKTYKVRLSGISIAPQAVIQSWKAKFPVFWPDFLEHSGKSRKIIHLPVHEVPCRDKDVRIRGLHLVQNPL